MEVVETHVKVPIEISTGCYADTPVVSPIKDSIAKGTALQWILYVQSMLLLWESGWFC